MKIARYRAGSLVTYGIVEGDTVTDITGTPFEKYEVTGQKHALSEVKLLAPGEPRNLLGAGINSETHRANQTKEGYVPAGRALQEPQVLVRSVGSIVGHEDKVVRWDYPDRINEEVELVVVIGKTITNVTGPAVFDYIFGYTVGNDVTNWGGEETRQVWRAKNADTSHPIGPWIETDLDPSDAMMRARVNGKVTQEQSTSAYNFDVPKYIGYISRYHTLYPGDMVFMGTVGSPGEINPGDVVEVEIEGIGTLRNYVISEAEANRGPQ